jgi:hypothetical protein
VDDSLECRNCHSAQSMDITKQSPRASDAHQRFLFTGEKTRIDCHKGIAHHLPDMRGIPVGSSKEPHGHNNSSSSEKHDASSGFTSLRLRGEVDLRSKSDEGVQVYPLSQLVSWQRIRGESPSPQPSPREERGEGVPPEPA